jgi:hypothetical protein
MYCVKVIPFYSATILYLDLSESSIAIFYKQTTSAPCMKNILYQLCLQYPLSCYTIPTGYSNGANRDFFKNLFFGDCRRKILRQPSPCNLQLQGFKQWDIGCLYLNLRIRCWKMVYDEALHQLFINFKKTSNSFRKYCTIFS